MTVTSSTSTGSTGGGRSQPKKDYTTQSACTIYLSILGGIDSAFPADCFDPPVCFSPAFHQMDALGA